MKLIRLVLILIFIGALSWSARTVFQLRLFSPGAAAWSTHDPDGMYHMRRVDRVLTEGLPVAEHDPFMNFPHGARIPWPPYYTLMLSAITAPFAPEGAEARREFVEHAVAMVPQVLGVVTTIMVALCGFLLAGSAGALLAGSYHAFCSAAILYSKAGVADHHAWISFLLALTLLLLSAALKREATRSVRASALFGAGLGAVAGVMLGSWVASLVYVLTTQLVLAWMLFRNARSERSGTAAFGLAYHATALLVLLPAVLSSPWKKEFPWMVVNLSWFHLAHLLVGGLVFVPLFFLKREGVVRRRYPWLVGAALALLVSLLFLTRSPVWHGVIEGFSWASRADRFMANVTESVPLLGEHGRDFQQAFLMLGYGILLTPVIFLFAGVRALRDENAQLRPWVVMLPVLTLMAFSQVRFADVLSLPTAVCLAWFVVQIFRLPLLARVRSLPAWCLFLPLIALSLALQWPTTRSYATSVASAGLFPEPMRLPRARATRAMLDWLRENTPADGEAGVLARWSHGHRIEWVADRPTIATNFGSYLGEESFLFPARLFLTEDPLEAEALLKQRRIRWILLTSLFLTELPSLLENLRVHEIERDLLAGAAGGRPNRVLTHGWHETIAARLMSGGVLPYASPGSTAPLNFLRLVHVSPRIERDPALLAFAKESPMGWIWEVVPGALVEASGTPGERLLLQIPLAWNGGRERLVYTDHAVVGADGIARLRVPYATDTSNGDASLAGRPRWSLAGVQADLVIPGRAVQQGDVVRLK